MNEFRIYDPKDKKRITENYELDKELVESISLDLSLGNYCNDKDQTDEPGSEPRGNGLIIPGIELEKVVREESGGLLTTYSDPLGGGTRRYVITSDVAQGQAGNRYLESMMQEFEETGDHSLLEAFELRATDLGYDVLQSPEPMHSLCYVLKRNENYRG